MNNLSEDVIMNDLGMPWSFSGIELVCESDAVYSDQQGINLKVSRRPQEGRVRTDNHSNHRKC